MKALFFLAWGFLALAAPALAALPQNLGDELPMGKNAAGESCRLRLEGRQPEQFDSSRYALYCEGWSQPSGQLRRFLNNRKVGEMLTEGGYAKALETRV